MKIGDYVRLKSGGPLMQIGGMSMHETAVLALCVWGGFTADQEDWFDVRMLDLVPLGDPEHE
jgi:uncharacterized protein YodC (DUF2158 family)